MFRSDWVKWLENASFEINKLLGDAPEFYNI